MTRRINVETVDEALLCDFDMASSSVLSVFAGQAITLFGEHVGQRLITMLSSKRKLL